MEFNVDLISDLARQRVVIFLGAGVSASAQTADGKPILGWEGFLKWAADRAGGALRDQVAQLIEEKDYLLSCEILQSHFVDDWEDLVSQEFGKTASPSDLHRSILALKQRIILTTNFDKVLESAWSDPSTGSHYPRVYSVIDERIFRALKDHEGSYLMKIHGTVDDPGGIIFSRSQYIRGAFGNAHYSGFLESLLLNYTFLFIGFSMSDPAITSLMELYALRYPKSRPHYIISGSVFSESMIEINKRLRKLSIIQYDPGDHHAALPGVVADLGAQAMGRRRQIFSSFLV